MSKAGGEWVRHIHGISDTVNDDPDLSMFRQPIHICSPPELVLNRGTNTYVVPGAGIGSLWLCECNKLWRLGEYGTDQTWFRSFNPLGFQHRVQRWIHQKLSWWFNLNR